MVATLKDHLVINLELSHFIAKFYLVALSICFVFSFININKNKSNFIVVTFAFLHCFIDQFIIINLGFYTFYLWAAFECLVFILLSAAAHLYFKIIHVKTSVIIYVIYLLIALSYLILHRVRVVIYSTDDPILWFINSQSVFVLILYFFSNCIVVYGSRIKWNSVFGRYFL